VNKTILRNAILATEHPPRNLVVEYIKLLCDEARQIPFAELATRVEQSMPRTFPATRGEDIASDISSCLAQQNWIDWRSDPQLEEIGSIAASLEIHPDNKEAWLELFEKIDRLKPGAN